MSEGYVGVEGGRLWHERRGEGFPVLLLHPDLWDVRIWDDQFDGFAEHHDVVRYDRRGHGRSDPPRGSYSALRDLRTLLAELAIDRCALVGCAGGARLALDFAIAYPDAADAVVAVSPEVTGYRWNDPGVDLLARQVREAVAAGDLAGAVEVQLAVWAPVASAADPRVRAIAMANAGVLLFGEDLAEAPSSAVARLGDVQAAMLVVVGDRDLAEIQAIADLIVGAVPGASKRVVAGADQLVNIAKREKFDRLVLDFLAFRM